MNVMKKVLICFAFFIVVCGVEPVYAAETDASASYSSRASIYFTRKTVDGEMKYYVSGEEVTRDKYY